MIDTGYNRGSTVLLVLVLIVGQLHLLRNISTSYHALYFVCLLISFWFVLVRWVALRSVEKKVIVYVIAIFFMPIVSVLPGAIAEKYDSLEDILVGILRVMFSLPIYLVILASPSDRKTINILLVAVALITLIAALSVPYQFLFGAISWFAMESERAGLDRFSSLFGSLTALGGVVGCGLLAAVVSIRSAFWSAATVSGIVLGALLSLQKAAVANIVLCLLYLVLVKNFDAKRIYALAIYFLIVFGLVSAFFIGEISSFLKTVQIFSSSDFSGDFSFQESIWQRFLELPSVAVDFHGASSLLFGIGPVGGSGALGYPDVPMSHNGFVDLFLVGGIGFFLLFICSLLFVFSKSRQDISEFDLSVVRFGTFCLFLLLLNMLFSGLTFFTPSGAMFFAVSIKCLLLKR